MNYVQCLLYQNKIRKFSIDVRYSTAKFSSLMYYVQITLISQDEKGSIFVPVIIEDESGEAPIECQMEWAWITKRKR